MAESYGPKPIQDEPIDPERDWSRGARDLGMNAPGRMYERADVAGIIGNRPRAMNTAQRYTQGYQLPTTSSSSSRNMSRNSYANMTISPPAEVVDVTKKM